MEKVHIHPRKLARRVAKAQLDKGKVTGYNKQHVGMDGRRSPSAFARGWRKIVVDLRNPGSPVKKGRKKAR